MELQEMQTQGNLKSISSQQDYFLNPLQKTSSSLYGVYFRGLATSLIKKWYFKCQICLEQFQNNQSVFYTSCAHTNNFCHSCLYKYFKFKLMLFEEIRCPKEGCSSQINKQSSFFKNLAPSIQKRYNKIATCYQKLHDANFRVCPSQNCQGNIVYKESAFCCTVCKQLFCLDCLGKKHDGECYMQEVAFFQNILHFRRCPNCKFIIQRSAGCNHMTCVCKYQFCYTCNDVYTVNHLCQYDQLSKVKIKNPRSLKESKRVNIDDVAQHQAQFQQKPKISKCEFVLLTITLGIVLTPLYTIVAISFVLWMTVLSIFQLILLGVALLIIILLGLGPFAFEFSKQRSKIMMAFLILCFPIGMIIGVYRGFKELSSVLLWKSVRIYIKNVKHYWKVTCQDIWKN